MNVENRQILQVAAGGDELSREQILALLQPEAEGGRDLFAAADRLRQKHMGDRVHLRGIIEFSNYCRRNCWYCGLRKENARLPRYRMSPREVVAVASQGALLGYRTVVLQSGEDPWYTAPVLAAIIREIKQAGVAVTLSVGERPFAHYRMWREAGADRYLLKFETSDHELYARLHPGTSLKTRLRHLEQLQNLGYQVGSGNIVGLPGQTAAMLAGDIILMRQLRLEMAGIGPFIPHPGTPLGSFPAGDVALSLRVLACARLMMPWCHLPATTALGSLAQEGRRLGLEAGGNVVMVNLTPPEYRRLYEIYPHKAAVSATAAELYREAQLLVRQLGLEVAADQGHGLLSGQEVYSCGTGNE